MRMKQKLNYKDNVLEPFALKTITSFYDSIYQRKSFKFVTVRLSLSKLHQSKRGSKKNLLPLLLCNV